MEKLDVKSKKNKIKLEYYIGGIKHTQDEIKTFIPKLAKYQHFKIRIFFGSSPLLHDEITFSSTYYILKMERIKKLENNKIYVQDILYSEGLCGKIKKFNYEIFYKNLNKRHCTSNVLKDLFVILVKDHKCNCVWTNYNKIFKVTDILHKNDDGSYYYDYKVSPEADIMCNFNITSDKNDFSLSYYIGNTEYTKEQINKFISVASLKIRMTFQTMPLLSDEFVYSAEYNVLDGENRNILEKSKIETKYILYENGRCINKSFPCR
jgi:hypothetical protein